MHLEILVEDSSGAIMLEHLLDRMVDRTQHSWKIHSYRGIGRLPSGLVPRGTARHRILLDQLPRILAGYGKSLPPVGYAVVVVCDLDDASLSALVASLNAVLQLIRAQRKPAPETRFCVAIEEGEAWLLGDRGALMAAYPGADRAVLAAYVQDSICGTWELLADVVEPGGAGPLVRQGDQVAGAAKARWADAIGQRMDPDANLSPSFVHFRDEIRALAP